MSRAAISDTPAVLGTLPEAAVIKYLSRAIQSGQETPPQVILRKASAQLPAQEQRWRTAAVRELLDEAMHRFDTVRTSADRWLAPRLHATLRMTRAEAADNGKWNYLAMLVAPDYVVWRHKGPEVATPARFAGPHYTQAFARLWWAAELFRNGADYSPVETACRVQDVLNTTMRLDVIDHRPTALAIVAVLERLIADGSPRLGDQMNALSSAVNAAGSTLVYDTMAADEPPDSDALHHWIAESAGMAPVPWDRLPQGPDDGAVNKRSVEALVPLFESLLADAPVRQRLAIDSDV
ncbi:MAG: hypothetical protein HOV77_09705 [Hamadaea sp.]|uniref:DUF6339 family protein n=1 Tax=Hamadaea sp. TaxID=2024425 RepID=UPI00184FD0F4|nr:DUF6339 family protein [Hamadaea sp.]NUT19451.1 hypothetical protein [Hamadaea sp.]